MSGRVGGGGGGRIRSSSGREKSRVQQLVELGRGIWLIGTIELI